MLVCTLGDLTLDVVVRLSGPIAEGGDTNAEIHVGPGGQAANVAAWAAELGAAARFIGKTGADDAGVLVRQRLAAFGVEILGPVEGRNGSIFSLVSRRANARWPPTVGRRATFGLTRSNRRGSSAARTSTSRAMHSCVEPVRSAALRAAELARGQGARVSLDLASWSAIRDSGVDAFRDAARALAPELVFANEDEERIVGALDGARWILKRGRAGCSFDGDERSALPVERVLDSTGAGDALAAGWIVGGPDLALEAAARCVQQPGAMPVASSRRRTRLRDLSMSEEVRDGTRRGTRRSSRSRRRSSRTGFRRPTASRSGWRCEHAVREAGAMPATIGVFDGRIRDRPRRRPAGALRLPARASSARAISRRVQSQGALGATTVGGMLAVAPRRRDPVHGNGRHRRRPPRLSRPARRVGRPRGAAHGSPRSSSPPGSSRSSTSLRRWSMLETLGIPVLGYRTDTLPLFYAGDRRATGVGRVSTSRTEVARIAAAHWQLGGNALLVGPATEREPRGRAI